MRKKGAIALLLGIAGFFYCSSRLAELPPLPEGLSLSEGLREVAGRWDIARYGCGGVGLLGLLMTLFPKGR
jgi:hypothetical protein